MARVSLDDGFFGSDKRILYLAQITNEPAYVTRGRLVQVYHACYRKASADLSAKEVDIQAEWSGPKHYIEYMIESELADSGQITFKVRGVQDRIVYILQSREKGRLGGIRSGEARRKQTLQHQLSKPPSPANPTSTLTSTSTPTTNTTYAQNGFCASVAFDFEGVYKKYPRKRGKIDGLRYCRENIKSREEFEKFSRSVDIFAKEMKKENRPEKKIPYFSTFVISHWQDFTEESNGSAKFVNFETGEVKLR